MDQRTVDLAGSSATSATSATSSCNPACQEHPSITGRKMLPAAVPMRFVIARCKPASRSLAPNRLPFAQRQQCGLLGTASIPSIFAKNLDLVYHKYSEPDGF